MLVHKGVFRLYGWHLEGKQQYLTFVKYLI